MHRTSPPFRAYLAALGTLAALLAFAAAALAAPGASGATPSQTPSASITLSDPGFSPAAIGLSWNATNDLLFTDYEIMSAPASSNPTWTSVGTVSDQASTSFFADGLLPG